MIDSRKRTWQAGKCSCPNRTYMFKTSSENSLPEFSRQDVIARWSETNFALLVRQKTGSQAVDGWSNINWAKWWVFVRGICMPPSRRDLSLNGTHLREIKQAAKSMFRLRDFHLHWCDSSWQLVFCYRWAFLSPVKLNIYTNPQTLISRDIPNLSQTFNVCCIYIYAYICPLNIPKLPKCR